MSTKQQVTIAAESPLTDDMRGMIHELNAVLRSLTPEEANYSMTAEEMAGSETTLLIARVNGEAAACGALYRHKDSIGELKRFYVRPAFRGQGLAILILDRITSVARQEGFTSLVLETGYNYDAARRLYEKSGFQECGPVLDYPESPYSVFYSRPLKAS